MMRRRTVVTSVIALGFSLSGQALAQGAPKPAPAPAKPVPAPAKPAPAKPAPAPVAPAPAAPTPPVAPAPAAPPAADAAAPPSVSPPQPPVAPPAEVAPTEPPAPQPLQPAPAPAPTEVASPEPAAADPEPDLPPAENYSEGGDSWYDSIDFSAFADGYFGVNYNFPKPQYGRNVLRAFDTTNGFALSWVGVNASYAPDPVGATISLRFGPTAHQIGTGCVGAATFDGKKLGEDKSLCDSGVGIENVKQAFASWKPGGADGMFQIDFGKFDTPFGAEVAESHLNMNYTRGMLYLSQPVFHTGLRASFTVSDALDFKVLAVNGWNNSVDNNVGKSFGAQVNFHLKNNDEADLLGVSVGYLGGPEHGDTLNVSCADRTAFDAKAATGCSATTLSPVDVAIANRASGVLDKASSNTDGWRHLIDLVVTSNPIERLRLVLNADFGVDRSRSETNLNNFQSKKWYGVMAGGRVAVVEQFGVAVRGEYFRDTHGFINPYPQYPQDLVGGTLTLDYLPSDYLMIRLDNRVDWSSREIFNKGVRDTTGTQITSTLGVVAHTD